MWLHPKEGDDSQAVLSACLRASHSEISEKKNPVYYLVCCLFGQPLKSISCKKKNVKNDTTTYQFIDMLHRVCGMKVLSKIFLNVFWESCLPDKIHKCDYDLQFFICCKLLPLDMPRVFSLK